jgi:CheY-like chemotaxis protein
MRHDTDLLWIRTAAPGSGDTSLVESLDRFIIHAAHDVEDSLARLRGETADVILAEFPLPGWTPSELLEAIQQINPRLLVVIRDPDGTVADAVRLVKSGAYHFMGGALDENEVIECLERAAEKRRLRNVAVAVPDAEPWKGNLVGDGRSMRDIEHIIRLAGPKRSTVLILGETGTGKEYMAGIENLPPATASLPQTGAEQAKIEKAAKQFESLLIGQIMKSMHEAGSSGWMGGGDDQAGEAAMEMAEDQFAQALASRGGLGLARLIMQGLTARSAEPSETQPPAQKL